jgi:hypothetical protein
MALQRRKSLNELLKQAESVGTTKQQALELVETFKGICPTSDRVALEKLLGK